MLDSYIVLDALVVWKIVSLCQVAKQKQLVFFPLCKEAAQFLNVYRVIVSSIQVVIYNKGRALHPQLS